MKKYKLEIIMLSILAILGVVLKSINCYYHTDEKLEQYRKELDAKGGN